MRVESRRTVRRLLGVGIGVAGLVSFLALEVQAGWPRARRTRVVTTSAPVAVPRATGLAASPMLGQFYPEPYLNIRGNFETGGGYSPLGTYGDSTAAMYGPLSSFRTSSAPVLLYQRGYDGSFRPELGTGFSTPNFPAASSIVYPSRANVVGGPRRTTSPPQWDSAIDWIDRN
ncbi:MAG: hypothetical protein JWN86_3975 [Planctomycetota bacterium]|nr:hypothetical protein [Planctomycetota bacterium]